MTAAIFGLLGVIVGAAINGAIATLLQRRTEQADQRSAARLVRSELVRFRALAIEAGQRSPEHLPQLHDMTPALWHDNRAVLARALEDADWAAVAGAYAHVDAVQSVLVFESDGTLVEWRRHEAQRLFAGAVGPLERAAMMLGRAAGFDSDELDEAPETFPVAA